MDLSGVTGAQRLSGTWKAALDPDILGRESRWFDADPVDGARDVPVPGTFQQAFPLAHGVAWYWHTFVPDRVPAAGERALLRFQAVDYLAEVWLNGRALGGHEGGETPFSLDATDALRPGENLLAVRVLNPGKEPIDGIVLSQTPHRNKMLPDDFRPGNGRNYGGIVQPVDLLLVPAVRIVDLVARPDWESGRIDVIVSVRNDGEAPVRLALTLAAGPAQEGTVLAAARLDAAAPPGESRHQAALQIPRHRLWSLEDPFLYRLAASLEATGDDGAMYRHEQGVRCGFRDFRVVNGYFRLNGRRLFLRSTHTGNHFPIGFAVPTDPDLVRRDLILAKATGFNTVRFISGMALAEQLDFCDEIGLLVYEESLAAWLLRDSPRLGERFDRSVREMILRDRNHPSVAIWGLLNETSNGPTFRHAVTMLGLIRDLDPTRPVLLSSGRWDDDWSIGSVCNPGSSTWEAAWGMDGEGAPPALPGDGVTRPEWGQGHGGYVEGAGDAHVYPQVPQSSETNRFLRTLGQEGRPVFLSEYGIGSLLDVVQIMGRYQQTPAIAAPDDLLVFQTMLERLEADWERFGMAPVYPFPRDLLRESQRLHSRQRLLGFNLIRANPRLAGYNLTGMLDHGYTGEGLWTFWREWKPGIAEVLEDGFAPLRWCLFAEPLHVYAGRTVVVEAILANEDVLQPGAYLARLRLFGPAGSTWDRRVEARIPEVAAGADGPLAVPVLREEVRLDGPPGIYTLAAQLEQGGSPAGDRLTFHVSDPAALPDVRGAVTLWGVEERVTAWLQGRGLDCRPFEASASGGGEVILVGDLSGAEATEGAWRALLERIARGGVAVFLSPEAFRRGDDPVGRLPLATRGRCYAFSNWLYHREDVGRPHPIFTGLPAPGILDWEYYGPVIPSHVFEGQETPDDIAAVYFALGYASMTETVKSGYTAGLLAASYPFGAGRFLINSLRILENIDRHPAADRLLLNTIAYAAGLATAAPAQLPGDFEAQLRSLGFDA